MMQRQQNELSTSQPPPSLCQLVEAIDLARVTLRRIRYNLGWALAYNCCAIPVAAGVLLPNYDVALTPALAGGWLGWKVCQVSGR